MTTGRAKRPLMPVTIAPMIPAAVHNVVATIVTIERIVSLFILRRGSGVCVCEVETEFRNGLFSVDVGIDVVIMFTSNNVLRSHASKNIIISLLIKSHLLLLSVIKSREYFKQRHQKSHRLRASICKGLMTKKEPRRLSGFIHLSCLEQKMYVLILSKKL